MSVSEILKAAKARSQNPEHWTQEKLARDASGDSIFPTYNNKQACNHPGGLTPWSLDGFVGK